MPNEWVDAGHEFADPGLVIEYHRCQIRRSSSILSSMMARAPTARNRSPSPLNSNANHHDLGAVECILDCRGTATGRSEYLVKCTSLLSFLSAVAVPECASPGANLPVKSCSWIDENAFVPGAPALVAFFSKTSGVMPYSRRSPPPLPSSEGQGDRTVAMRRPVGNDDHDDSSQDEDHCYLQYPVGSLPAMRSTPPGMSDSSRPIKRQRPVEGPTLSSLQTLLRAATQDGHGCPPVYEDVAAPTRQRRSRSGSSSGSGPKKCIHGKTPYYCTKCGGKGVCDHGRQKCKCKDCGGSAICVHDNVKYQCKECKRRCEHGCFTYKCKVCSRFSMPATAAATTPTPAPAGASTDESLPVVASPSPAPVSEVSQTVTSPPPTADQ